MLAELGQEYAAITLRQETGMDMFGDVVNKFEPNDTERLNEIEKIFADNNEHTLMQYVENAFEIQKDNS